MICGGQAAKEMNVVDDLSVHAFEAHPNACDNRRVTAAHDADVPATAGPPETESVRLDGPDFRRPVCGNAKRTDRIDVVAHAKVKPGQVFSVRAPANEVAAAF